MKILFGIDPVDGWIRAASNLGHQGFKLDIDKSFDCFNKYKPDLVIIDSCLSSKCLDRALDKFRVNTIKIDKYMPACDAPPNFKGGNFNKDFECEALLIGTFKSEYKPIISILEQKKINYKIFGYGYWFSARKLGLLTNTQVADAYKSAKWSLDLEADSLKVLTILASGGHPLSAGKWNTGVEVLDTCKTFESLENMIEIIKSEPSDNKLSIPTLSDRLSELLGNIS